MKTYIKLFCLIIFVHLVTSCDQEMNEPLNLSDIELESFLNENVDFQSFITLKKTEFESTNSIIESMSDKNKKALDRLTENYSGYSNFIENATKEEKAFFEKNLPTKENDAIEHLKNVLTSLSSYNYNRDKLFDIIALNLQFSKDNKYYRTKYLCWDFRNDVYISQLNYYTNWMGWSYEDADNQAYIEASWAYYGCVMGN